MEKKMNRFEVAEAVCKKLEYAKEYKSKYGCNPKFRIHDVCEELSIFDWWNENLSVSQLNKMKRFLELACELGYNGYVCFKVGATGCSNGMWAYKAESENGYSPNGEAIYRSFTPAYKCYDFCDENGNWYGSDNNHDEIKNATQLKKIIAR